MKNFQNSFYQFLKLLAVAGFGILFYFVITDKTSSAPMLMLSLLTSVCLIAIPGMKNVLNENEETTHES
ncbi:hypothetical protein JOC95_002938 [Bacillus tianshenii]|uniref:Group-specific protein n=1 Tax=Sutcliffiella tianshenii TaxID=1463404 RepID=A0ABS2P3T2_9BACI|nr:hypothetical protein [Bacillus tianshenii]MBM7621065.1 hypothetical protein [Bacillus tianshenii]